MPTCPSCGTNDPRVYHGAMDVECPSAKCVHYCQDLLEETKPDIKVPRSGGFTFYTYANPHVANPAGAPRNNAPTQPAPAGTVYALGALAMTTTTLGGGGVTIRKGALVKITAVLPGARYQVTPDGGDGSVEMVIEDAHLAPAA